MSRVIFFLGISSAALQKVFFSRQHFKVFAFAEIDFQK